MTMALPTSSELIFSEQASHNFSKILSELKRHTLSISNRLNSIITDSRFVQRAAAAYQRPLIANERCGSWYIDPEYKDGSAYFKSTDGHSGVWKFSTRRLNLHLLQTIGNHDGCIVVDSTRRGKRMPDALSKTIPIWCCVINRTLFADQPLYHELFTPPKTVSVSEHAQIEALLDEFVQSFISIGCDLEALRKHIPKPLRPVWLTPESDISPMLEIFQDYHPVICCTASRRVSGAENSAGGYIQGSGDDTENWAHGLTAPIFWANSELLLSTAEHELPELIAELIARPITAVTESEYSPIPPTSSLYIMALDRVAIQSNGEREIIISLFNTVTDSSSWQVSPSQLNIGIGQHKLGSRNLRAALPFILNFVMQRLRKMEPDKDSTALKLIIRCTSGKDHSVGVALALLCILYDEKGLLIGGNRNDELYVDKSFIRRRLGWIMLAMPGANPSRATLQSVNSYLMDRPQT